MSNPLQAALVRTFYTRTTYSDEVRFASTSTPLNHF